MELISLAEIQRKMLEQYTMLDSEIPELNMKNSSLSVSEVETLETQIGSNFPEDFRAALLRFEFGDLNIGGVFFGQAGSYEEFLKNSNLMNLPGCWWGSEDRQKELIMIAGTDSYVILLDCVSGNVFCFPRGQDWNSMTLVACDFQLFLQGAGTIFFKRKNSDDKDALGKEVGKQCVKHDQPPLFWSELAQGFA